MVLSHAVVPASLIHIGMLMNDERVQLDTYTEVYDANDYPEYETRPIELFSPLHKLVPQRGVEPLRPQF
jgi:hypothetical protein